MSEVIKRMEELYPECTNELLDNFDKAYKLWCKKQSDYGDGNIRLGLNISSKSSSQTNKALSQLGVVIRMNDKIQRLINIYKKNIFYDKGMDIPDESIEDTSMDIMNYSNMLLVLLNDKWGK